MPSLIGCLRREYRYRIVDTIVNRVLPCEVAQAVKGSNDTRFYGVGSGDAGKELPRNKSVVSVCCALRGELSLKHHGKRFQDACLFQGYRVNHCCTRCPPHIPGLFWFGSSVYLVATTGFVADQLM